jgi:hypothetical protein
MLQRLFTSVEGSSSLLIVLRDYVRAGAERCRVSWQVEGVSKLRGRDNRLHPLQVDATLAEAMHGQVVVEYPRLLVALTAHDVEHGAGASSAVGATCTIRAGPS